MSSLKKLYILYDGRARSGDTFDAAVLTTTHDEQEARKETNEHGDGAIWFEYDVSGDQLINEVMRSDL